MTACFFSPEQKVEVSLDQQPLPDSSPNMVGNIAAVLHNLIADDADAILEVTAATLLSLCWRKLECKNLNQQQQPRRIQP
eukprot:scaffold32535_cov21-Prasinocladus_malaysianus.AAC.1